MKLSKKFLARLGEQALVAGLVGFGGVVAASDSITKAVLAGGFTAALRAAYGVLVRNVGENDTPSVK